MLLRGEGEGPGVADDWAFLRLPGAGGGGGTLRRGLGGTGGVATAAG
jgi:hypothetical protein